MSNGGPDSNKIDQSGNSDDHKKLLQGVDEFIDCLSSTPDKSNAPDISNSVESFLKELESKVSLCENSFRISHNPEDNALFYDSIPLLCKLMSNLDQFSGDPKTTPCFNRASWLLHRAMCVLDDDFRFLLDKKPSQLSDPKSSNLASSNPDPDQSPIPELEEFPGFLPEAISGINRIATAMILGGYDAECCLVYSALRRNAFKAEFLKLGYENVSMDEVQKMQWEALEGEIATWINIVSHYSSTLFSGERKLSTSVFSNSPAIARRLFHDITSAVTFRLVNFATAVALTKRSSEKLFKFLDMYESLSELTSGMDDDTSDELKAQTLATQSRIGEAAVAIFGELENSIRSDNGRPVPSGAVHPLTRYTMNYLKYASAYKNTLEQVFQKHKTATGTSARPDPDPETEDADEKPKTSPFSLQLMAIMDLLDTNLVAKSKQYKDPALRDIFLMNNGRYIVQKVKGAREIYEMLGQAWTRMRSSNLKMLHKNYQRETWGRVLQCIGHEGVQVNGKVAKPVLKERFKSFNSMFDEIHKTQSTWVVCDEQLQSELRVSISAVVIPAYRSFLGRFKQHFNPGRQTEKYIKYQPEDIESLIENLFDGNPTSMSRKRN